MQAGAKDPWAFGMSSRSRRWRDRFARSISSSVRCSSACKNEKWRSMTLSATSRINRSSAISPCGAEAYAAARAPWRSVLPLTPVLWGCGQWPP